MIVQGDAYVLPFSIRAGETLITPSMVTDVIVQFGTIQRTYSNNEVVYVNGQWGIPLTHEETLQMNGMTGLQVEVQFEGGIRKRSRLMFEVIEPTIIEEVQGNE